MRSQLPEQSRQGIDYGETANIQSLHAALARAEGESRVTVKAFSLWSLVVCGLVFFFAAFFSARYSDSSGTATTPPNSQSVSPTLQAQASPASMPSAPGPDTGGPAVVHVVMRNMKFDPPTIEVKSGDTVEWKNEDITPHTATFASFDSASIDSDKSWKHTFGEPGNFPYNCTFHPEMKAVVIVK